MLVGIAGRKGVGKDTVADYLVQHHGYVRKSFADPIKTTVVDLFRLEPHQMEGDEKEAIDPRHNLSPRQMMQLVGTDMFRRMVRDSFWTDYFTEWFLRQPDGTRVVVPDVRFQNEVDVIKSLGGIVIRIDRNNDTVDGRHLLKDMHESEIGVSSLQQIDQVIMNDDTITHLCENIERLLYSYKALN